MSKVTERITYSGAVGEGLFLRLIDFSHESKKSSRGDVLVVVDGKPHYVEIKTCRDAKSGNANQVRAIKFITLVIYTPNRENEWIVIPANEVVRLVAEKPRGQHTEISFECSTLGLGEQVAGFQCSSEELPDRVAEAIRESEEHEDLKRSMDLLRYDLKRLSYRARDEVDSILNGERPTYWED